MALHMCFAYGNVTSGIDFLKQCDGEPFVNGIGKGCVLCIWVDSRCAEEQVRKDHER